MTSSPAMKRIHANVLDTFDESRENTQKIIRREERRQKKRIRDDHTGRGIPKHVQKITHGIEQHARNLQTKVDRDQSARRREASRELRKHTEMIAKAAARANPTTPRSTPTTPRSTPRRSNRRSFFGTAAKIAIGGAGAAASGLALVNNGQTFLRNNPEFPDAVKTTVNNNRGVIDKVTDWAKNVMKPKEKSFSRTVAKSAPYRPKKVMLMLAAT